jgi:hypothetical protein
MQDKNLTGKLDRRIEFHRPADSENEYNETQTEFVKAFEKIPAHRSDNVTTDSEGLNGKVIHASNITEWTVRFMKLLAPGSEDGIKSSWKIRDMHSGQWYEIISPVTEMGRKQSLRIKSKLIE